MIIGKRISGRYKILDMIGGGGMANVYLAHDMILDRDVAVKMLRLDFANDEEFIKRFDREAQSATSLAHPNIVSIYDVGEEDDLYYIVMEFVDGQTLKQYIQQKAPIPVQETLDIMKQLTSGISHAHQNHIVHRDIKPQNILIDPQGNVKITDFGIAMAMSATSITQTNSVLGSVHYLSPEQARGGMANKKSDVYSLGIVMFELLTGRLPFSGESAVSIALKHLQSETPSVKRWNPHIPQSVENIVLKATAKDPFHRYESVYEMEDDLRSALDTNRLNESKFVIPVDEEATKAIPVITDDKPLRNLDETIVHSNTGQNSDSAGAVKKTGKKSKNKTKKKWKWPIILFSIFILIPLLGILFLTVLPDVFGPKDVAVPDVRGFELEEAVTDLMEARFVIGERIRVTDEEVPEGLIIKTDPGAGRFAKEGREINLYISTGKERFQLLDYRGRDYEEVIRLLENKNFKDIRKTTEHNESAAGTILEQYPPVGEEVVPEETVLEFTVSEGPARIQLKDLTGNNEKGLQDYEETSGLKIVVAQEEYHDTIGEGLVISQNPEPGTELEKGSTVEVVISKGKEEIPPKDVTEEVTIPYDATLEGEPQEIRIYIEDMNRSMTEPADTFFITETEKRILEFKIPFGGRAGYRIIRDNSVIDEDVIPYPED